VEAIVGRRAAAYAGAGHEAIKRLEAEMYRHARNLEFEEAARIRDEIEQLREATFGVSPARVD
jgi:excinuclease ABC subunit B